MTGRRFDTGCDGPTRLDALADLEKRRTEEGRMVAEAEEMEEQVARARRINIRRALPSCRARLALARSPLSACNPHRRPSMALLPTKASNVVCATREDAQNLILFTTARISDALENFRYRSGQPDPEQDPYLSGLRSELVRPIHSFALASHC